MSTGATAAATIDTASDLSISSLKLPTLHHSTTGSGSSQQEKHTNDHDNNSTGTAATAQSTANPCFKQDPSRHHLPSHPLSLKPPPVELSLHQQPNSNERSNNHRRQTSKSSLKSSSFVTIPPDTVSIESGLTIQEDVLALAQQQNTSIEATNATTTTNTTTNTTSLEERAQQIILEARRQSSRSNLVNQRTEEILRQARLATSAQLMMRQQRAMSRNSSTTSRTNNTVDTHPINQTDTNEGINQSSDDSKTSSNATMDSLKRITDQKGTDGDQRSICDDNDQKDDDDDCFNGDDNSDSVQLFHTHSAEEVLELATSLLREAQAQLEQTNAMEPLKSSTVTSSAPALEVPGLISTPPRRRTRDRGENEANPTQYGEGTPLVGGPTLPDFQAASPSDSDIASLDDYDRAIDRLPSRFNEEGVPSMSREKILRMLDGMPLKSNTTTSTPAQETIPSANTASSIADASGHSGAVPYVSTAMKQAPLKPVVIKSLDVKQQPDDVSTIGSWFNYLLGAVSKDTETDDSTALDPFAVSCGSPQAALFRPHFPTVGASLVRTTNLQPVPPSYPEIVLASRKIDERLQEWVENQFRQEIKLPEDGSYQLGESKSIVVHEIMRGNWTWSTAWSPDGKRLAIATENHHLAVVETTSSTVWRVKHDRRMYGPPKKGTTQSIRSIAWGDNFIAIGGTGNAVSILAPNDPYPILHTITPTGFVGSMDWLPGTNKLLIGSRLGKAILVDVWVPDDCIEESQISREVQSTVLHTIDREKAWVNAVQFSRDAMHFAVGDSKGILGVYALTFPSTGQNNLGISNVANFKLEDSILDLEWSADGQYLYAGGEDFALTNIATQHWEPVHRIKRDRWVQFVSSSFGSSHVAVGGVSSEVSILDVNRGWENVINIGLKGLVPLSAKWHPRDQYLVLTGQNNSVLAIETTNARHVTGHFLRSVYAIRSIVFSPDGRLAAVGNESGIVTLFTLTKTTFVCAYELVVDFTGSLSMEWSRNGAYIAISAGNKVVIVARTETLPGSTPPNTSGFFVAKVIKDLGLVHNVSIDPTSRFVAASGTKTRILDATSNFKTVLEMENGGTTLANSWSPDGHWFAVIGLDHSLVIYDTSPMNLSRWQSVFSVKISQSGLALAWGPSSIEGLQYCAYGGEDKRISIVEIRTQERTWETVIDIPREGSINALDWNEDGLVAAAVSNGTVTILDLSYLQSGFAVNEMDYNWQRQALTCLTEIRRNKGKQSMTTVKWIPSVRGSESLLAFGGTDGELEILDLTERNRCRGFQSAENQQR
ncbi:anaphase-promoting complex subunit 11 RING-H2 finger-domain containing protein [Nitzschia inconspicua]|uniref:Anaphase-promoting complex subunit 11 RING-H2 finger-domain containing protein n=1 Tax=Nitzschia inconspicua TaxID=303405 RepID=A0A9K3KUQ1_9STRA|nr:anaphase-promoting complex subunit 11 RING-H2 finger-domain containing protein [Nitzschia inconspicua]